MKGFCGYLRLVLKKSAQIFPFVLIISILLAAVIAIILGGMLRNAEADDENQRFKIGVVGKSDNEYLEFGITALKTFDSSRYTVDIIEMSEDEAREKINRGKISAYVVITDDFIENAASGKIGKIKYVTTSGSQGLVSLFKTEITKVVSEILYESQKGIFGMESALDSVDKSDKALGYMNNMSFEYVSEIINRTDFYEVEVIGVGDNLSFNTYLLCGLSTLLLFLIGLSAVPTFVKSDRTLYRVLSSRGIKGWKQVVSEFIAYFLMIFAVSAILLICISLVPNSHEIFPELSRFISWEDVLSLGIKLIPAIIAICAYQFFFFEITSGVVSGILMQFLSAVFMGYITGLIYPINFFPDPIPQIASLLPSGAARSYISSAVRGATDDKSLLCLLAWSLCFVLLTVVIRHKRIVGKGRELI